MAYRASYSEAEVKSTPAYLPSIVSSAIGGLLPGAELTTLTPPTLNPPNKSASTSCAGYSALAAEKSGAS